MIATRSELKDRLANPISIGKTAPAIDNARAVGLLGICHSMEEDCGRRS